MMKRLVLALALCGLASACGTIQHYEVLQQEPNKLLAAGVGDVVLQVARSRDLANPMGKADLWGRRTEEGYMQVRYLGVDSDGRAVLSRRDVDIRSDETTVSRMGFIAVPTSSTSRSTLQTSGNTGGAPFQASGTVTTRTTGTEFIQTPRASTIVVPSGEVAIRVEPGGRTNVAGYTVQVSKADGSAIEYTIQR